MDIRRRDSSDEYLKKKLIGYIECDEKMLYYEECNQSDIQE